MYFSEPHEHSSIKCYKGKFNVTWTGPVNIIIFVINLIRLSFCIQIFCTGVFFKAETHFPRFIDAGHNFCSVMPINVAY